MEETELNVQSLLVRLLHLAAWIRLPHLWLAGSVPQLQPEKGRGPRRHLLPPCWAEGTHPQPWRLPRKRVLLCKPRKAASTVEENALGLLQSWSSAGRRKLRGCLPAHRTATANAQPCPPTAKSRVTRRRQRAGAGWYQQDPFDPRTAHRGTVSATTGLQAAVRATLP